MNKAIAVAVGAVLLLLLVLFSSTFTVKYNEVAIKTTFGRADEGSVVTETGLHYRLPVFIDKVTKLDTRLQLVESGLEEIETADGMQIVVRAFLLWKVDTEGDGPLRFYKSSRTIDGALEQLPVEFRTLFEGALSRYQFTDLVGETSRLAEAEAAIRAELATSVATRGIVPVTVGISQIVLPPKTSSAVLSRMKATRDVLAEAERNAGTAAAEGIRSQGRTTADKIRAFANQRAEEIRADGERDAKKYLEQMNEEPELARFLVWLDALDRTMSNNVTAILDTEFAPFHLMAPDKAVMHNGIPYPAGDAPEGATSEAGRPERAPERIAGDDPARSDEPIEEGS